MKTHTAIISILATVLIGCPLCKGSEESSTNQVKSKEAQAMEDVRTIHVQIGVFQMMNGRLPTEEEGIKALVERPDGDLPK